MKVAKLRMLRWIWCGVTRMDRIRYEYIKESFAATNIAGKMRKNRLRGFEYIKRRNNEDKVKAIGEIRVKRNWGRGRSKISG